MSTVESSCSPTAHLDGAMLQEAICQFAKEFSSCHTPFRKLELDASIRVVEIIDTLQNTEDPVNNFSELVDKIKALDPKQYETNPLYTFISEVKLNKPNYATSNDIATVKKVKKILALPASKRNMHKLASMLEEIYNQEGPSNTFVLQEFCKLTLTKASKLLEKPTTRVLAIAQIEVAFKLFTDSMRHDRKENCFVKKSIKDLITLDPTILQERRLKPLIGELYDAVEDKGMKSYIRQLMQPKYNFSTSFKLDWPYAKA